MNERLDEIAAELARVNTALDKALDRVMAIGTGVAQRARAAGQVARYYDRRAEVSTEAGHLAGLAPGNLAELLRHLGAIAAAGDEASARAWRITRDRLTEQADTIEKTAAAAFGDGMTYVPGVGRVRNTTGSDRHED